MSRRICVITGTRADYGLLRLLMQHLRMNRRLNCRSWATGMHLSPDYGLTYREIEQDGFRIDEKAQEPRLTTARLVSPGRSGMASSQSPTRWNACGPTLSFCWATVSKLWRRHPPP